MAITFDPATKRIVLDSASVNVSDIYIAWTEWVITSDNAKYLPAFRQVGGDVLTTGISIPLYFFLLNGWRVRPQESDHTLNVTGYLFVDGGGQAIVRTLGPYQVNVAYYVPAQAQAVATGGSSGPTPEAIADAVQSAIQSYLDKLDVSVSSRHPANAIIPANVKKINDTDVTGTGSPGNEWGPG